VEDLDLPRVQAGRKVSAVRGVGKAGNGRPLTDGELLEEIAGLHVPHTQMLHTANGQVPGVKEKEERRRKRGVAVICQCL